MAAPRFVLILDTDPALLRNLSAMIRACGYRAHSADSGPAALELARAHQAEIGGIMLDPAAGGPQLRALLRELRQLISGPIIFMSPLGASEVARQSRRSSIMYLAKPFGISELRVALTLIFGGQEQPALSLVEAEEQAPAGGHDDAPPAYLPPPVSAQELDALWAE